MDRKGFTLIELIVVVAIIAILAAIVLVALDPATRFENARDSVRASDVDELLTAIKLDQVDNGGEYLSNIEGVVNDRVYMIGTGSSGCNSQNSACDTDVFDASSCIDLSGLVTEGYLGQVPISPNGSGTWTSVTTGYTIEKEASGIVHVRACESENTTEIFTSG